MLCYERGVGASRAGMMRRGHVARRCILRPYSASIADFCLFAYSLETYGIILPNDIVEMPTSHPRGVKRGEDFLFRGSVFSTISAAGFPLLASASAGRRSAKKRKDFSESGVPVARASSESQVYTGNRDHSRSLAYRAFEIWRPRIKHSL